MSTRHSWSPRTVDAQIQGDLKKKKVWETWKHNKISDLQRYFFHQFQKAVGKCDQNCDLYETEFSCSKCSTVFPPEVNIKSLNTNFNPDSWSIISAERCVLWQCWTLPVYWELGLGRKNPSKDFQGFHLLLNSLQQHKQGLYLLVVRFCCHCLSASKPGKAASASKGIIVPEATLLPRAPANRRAGSGSRELVPGWTWSQCSEVGDALTCWFIFRSVLLATCCWVSLGSRGNTPLLSWGHVEALEGSVPASPRVCAKGQGPRLTAVQSRSKSKAILTPRRSLHDDRVDWWRQADLRAEGMPDSPYSDHTSGFAPLNSWIIPLLRAQSCCSWTWWSLSRTVFPQKNPFHHDWLQVSAHSVYC